MDRFFGSFIGVEEIGVNPWGMELSEQVSIAAMRMILTGETDPCLGIVNPSTSSASSL